MMSYNNVFKMMTDTHSKSFVKLVCCNVGKEIHYVTVITTLSLVVNARS